MVVTLVYFPPNSVRVPFLHNLKGVVGFQILDDNFTADLHSFKDKSSKLSPHDYHPFVLVPLASFHFNWLFLIRCFILKQSIFECFVYS